MLLQRVSNCLCVTIDGDTGVQQAEIRTTKSLNEGILYPGNDVYRIDCSRITEHHTGQRVDPSIFVIRTMQQGRWYSGNGQIFQSVAIGGQCQGAIVKALRAMQSCPVPLALKLADPLLLLLLFDKYHKAHQPVPKYHPILLLPILRFNRRLRNHLT